MPKPQQRQPDDLSRSLTSVNMDTTLIVVIEMSQSSWLVAGIVPGIERQPLNKMKPDEAGLLALLYRWRDEASRAGHTVSRIAVAFEAGRDGFWLGRWLRAHGIDAHVIHASSVAVSREHRRAKTDRLDTELLKRAFLGWLRGERGHCKMVAIPSRDAEDAKRPHRERENLVSEENRIVNRMKAALTRLGIRGFNPKLKKAPERLEGLRTPEGEPIPPNTIAEFRRDMARRSNAALTKVHSRRLADGSPAMSFRRLLAHLATIVRNTMRPRSARPGEAAFTLVTRPNPKQQQALELIAAITV